MKKSFVEWIEEKHPEFEIDENLFNMARQAAGSVGRAATNVNNAVKRGVAKFNDTGVGRMMGRAQVGAERMGRKFTKLTGGNPYERASGNRERNAEYEKFAKDLNSWDDD